MLGRTDLAARSVRGWQRPADDSLIEAAQEEPVIAISLGVFPFLDVLVGSESRLRRLREIVQIDVAKSGRFIDRHLFFRRLRSSLQVGSDHRDR